MRFAPDERKPSKRRLSLWWRGSRPIGSAAYARLALLRERLYRDAIFRQLAGRPW
jgi:hypothetical protein